MRRRKSHRRKSRQRGGVLSTVVGGPLVYSNMGSWPGVNGYNGYYYSNNTNPFLQTSKYTSERGMVGGYVYSSKKNKKLNKKSKKNKFGGGFPLLRDLRLGTEVATNNIQNIINTSTGNPSQVSPLPYMNQYNNFKS
jgi:hypothetical protein